MLFQSGSTGNSTRPDQIEATRTGGSPRGRSRVERRLTRPMPPQEPDLPARQMSSSLERIFRRIGVESTRRRKEAALRTAAQQAWRRRMSQHVAEIRHRVISVPGGRIHLAEQGTGPLVLLVHGFPESWYSWRHQLPALATAGYRAAAVDVRGYGRSSKPAATDAYRMLELVQDNVSAVHALGKETAVVISHDWGATIAANSALLRPGGLPRGGTAERSQHPARRGTPQRCLRPDGRGRGVLLLELSRAGPRRGRDRTRCTRLARRLLRGSVRRHHASTRRSRPALRQQGQGPARPVPHRAG